MATSPVSASDFKTKFARNFTYGSGLDTVRDADISGAFDDALLLFNPGLFDTDSGKIAFMYLAAHFLVTTVQSAGGLSAAVGQSGINNRSEGVVLGKSVGQVSVNYEPPPDRVKKLGLQAIWQTTYGKNYITMLMPKMTGNVGVVSGPVDSLYGSIPIPDAGP